jgi:hypothetical protein
VGGNAKKLNSTYKEECRIITQEEGRKEGREGGREGGRERGRVEGRKEKQVGSSLLYHVHLQCNKRRTNF